MGCWLSEEDFLHNNIRYAEQWNPKKRFRPYPVRFVSPAAGSDRTLEAGTGDKVLLLR